jgi:hypothetical protein
MPVALLRQVGVPLPLEDQVQEEEAALDSLEGQVHQLPGVLARALGSRHLQRLVVARRPWPAQCLRWSLIAGKLWPVGPGGVTSAPHPPPPGCECWCTYYTTPGMHCWGLENQLLMHLVLCIAKVAAERVRSPKSSLPSLARSYSISSSKDMRPRGPLSPCIQQLI